MKPRYYGKDKIIAETASLDDLNHIELELEGGKKIIISNKMAKIAITEQPIDLTALRALRVAPVAKDILQVLLDWDILPFVPMSEVEYVLELVKTSYQENINSAMEKRFGKAREDITFSDIDKALKNA